MTPGYRARPRRRAVFLAVAAVLVLGAALLGGCARGDGGRGRTTVTIGTFGVFGYQQAGLYREYERLHPDVAVKESVIERNDAYYPQLLTHLAAGSGLLDIQAVEVGDIHELATAQGGLFEDLSAAKGVHRRDWLPWKWEQATTRDGRTIGLGTDIGPIAMCYRKDLFRRAGLPTAREAVGRLWAGDWRKYLTTGLAYKKRAPAGTVFTDSAAGIYNASVHGYAERYYDRRSRPIWSNSPAVRASWELAVRAARDGLTARLKQFEKPWDQAYANGRFATVACPPWMLGYIKEKSGPAGKDKWDVAPAPRPANWGGSFITVPKAARHKAAAVDLAVWLTAPAQQARLFERQASIPSTPASYAMPEVRDAHNPYFGGAPTGAIFAAAARAVPTLVYGPKEQQIGGAFTDVGIPQVEQQGKPPGAGWRAAQQEIENAVDE
ncbi:cellobiose transport system substrate-binding protein [Streptomyces olivoverticillatus]|uniref:Cellobiose transport system substrate-binding protein n=1 Tax=Streptomyces olivoverticillatus TaxID=66427 RepID=A0A7W7LL58_9ACTN|nr:extracellular solute-binding protein [Streptomyces olivoverticillatus]MBB4892245.1 cellobiose transport system substrate-binding protein [Streptomyces olivoverticillatus]